VGATLVPDEIEISPDDAKSLDPLLTEMDPDDVDEDDPLRTNNDPWPSEDVDNSVLPPGPLTIDTEPPDCDAPAPAMN